MNLNILIMTAIAAFMSLSCSGDKAGEEDSPLASRPFISASAEDGDNGMVEAQVDTIALTVKFNFTGRTDFSAVPVAFSLNEGYSIEGGDGEVIAQEKRVLKGWFPENPKRHEYYEKLRKRTDDSE